MRSVYDEIERIARHLLEDRGLHTTVKLNPTLLGRDTVRGLLNDRLGFAAEVPDAAFAHDPDGTDLWGGLLHVALPVFDRNRAGRARVQAERQRAANQVEATGAAAREQVTIAAANRQKLSSGASVASPLPKNPG
mgnify:CR=1 FL=1